MYKKFFSIMFFTSVFLLCEKKSLDIDEEVIRFKNKFNGISLFFEHAHEGIRRSVIQGLENLNIPYNSNPKYSQDTKNIIFCLDSITLLKRAIDLKNRNKIKKLLVGPNILARTHMENHILSNQAIDYYLTPSEWNRIACIEDEPSLKTIIRVWPAGVNADYWSPKKAKYENTKKVLIYWKTEPQEFCDKVKEILINYGWEPLIIKYNHYNHEQYKNLLNKVTFTVFLSKSESQGLALAECWSMNIPTLVWDSNELYYLEKYYDPVTSCPYLTDQTGKRWKELHELEDLLKNIESYWHEFSPREWVLNNMTDEVSVNLLLKIINE